MATLGRFSPACLVEIAIPELPRKPNVTRSRLQLIGTPFCALWALRHAATAIPLPQKSIFDLRVNAMEPLLSSLGFLLIGASTSASACPIRFLSPKR
jgi:hypothetical protein